jgi:UDP-N-acetylmuramoylalanine--D-glutamate ligase
MGESRYKLRDEVLKTGFNNINIHVVENMQEAVQTAFNIINSGECLLLSPGCPSWDMYESYRERGNDFKSEVEILRGKLL